MSQSQCGFHEVALKQSNSTTKKMIEMEKLKKQVKDVRDQLVNMKGTLQRLQFERNCMRRQLAEAGLLPPIISSFAYLTSTQLSELKHIEEFFQQRDSIHLENASEREEWGLFLRSTLGIPSSLHNSLVRKCVAYERIQMTASNFVADEEREMEYYPRPSRQGHVWKETSSWLEQPRTVIYRTRRSSSFFLNRVCCNTLLKPSYLSPKTITKTLFISFWKDRMLGRSEKQRLFTLLADGTNGERIKYITIKQIICDYLHDHPDIIQSIHQLEGLPYTEWTDRLCCHCCVYVTTVSAAILFDLTGLMSTFIRQRDVVFSDFVRNYVNTAK